MKDCFTFAEFEDKEGYLNRNVQHYGYLIDAWKTGQG